MGKFANAVAGFASESYILSRALNLRSSQERALMELAILWQCSRAEAATRAQSIADRTCYTFEDIVLRVKCGLQFD